jgi:hypothetical protein
MNFKRGLKENLINIYIYIYNCAIHFIIKVLELDKQFTLTHNLILDIIKIKLN